MRVLAFALVVVFVTGVACFPEEQAVAVQACLKEHNLLYGIYSTLRKDGYHGLCTNPSKEVKCGVKCIMTALKALTESGMMAETIIKQNADLLGKLDDKIGTDWQAQVQKCMDPSTYPVDNECTATWSMLKCVENVNQEFYPEILKSIGEMWKNYERYMS